MLNKAKHLALAKDNCIITALSFFAPFRSAQNDKLFYITVNITLTIIIATKLVNLSKLVMLLLKIEAYND